jgi:hypothetical protein
MDEEEAALVKAAQLLRALEYDYARLEAAEPPATLEDYLALLPPKEDEKRKVA